MDDDTRRIEKDGQSSERGYEESSDEGDAQSESSSLADLTESFGIATLGDNSHSELSPSQIQRVLRRCMRGDSNFRRDCQEREERNPFPDIDLNVGWNRARCELKMHFDDLHGTAEERKSIQEGFTQFGFNRQQDPLVLTEEMLAGMFEHSFVGVRREKSTWSREPGSWWGARKRVFAAGRGDLVEQLKATVRGIRQNVDRWRDQVGEIKGDKVSNLKRQYSTFVDTTPDETKAEVEVPRGKRLKRVRRKSEEVMSEAWRAKRRLQEQRAGRWTDGTLRMNGLWDGFHWVLDVEDPEENT